MRIIGSKDYYDSASAYGIDPGVVLVRDERVLLNADMDKIGNFLGVSINLSKDLGEDHRGPTGVFISSNYSNNYGTIDKVEYLLKDHAVIFCGKLYGGLEIRERPRMESHNDKTYFFWHLDKLTRWAEERGLRVGTGTYYWQRRDANEDAFKPTELGEQTVRALIEQRISIARRSEEPARVTSGRGSIGFAEADSGWRADGTGLGDIGFQSALDPVTAFQELAMWVGGTLSASGGPNTVQIQDDNVKAHKAGFDHWSFRKKTENSRP